MSEEEIKQKLQEILNGVISPSDEAEVIEGIISLMHIAGWKTANSVRGNVLRESREHIMMLSYHNKELTEGQVEGLRMAAEELKEFLEI